MGERFPAILSQLRREKGVNQRTAAGALHISQALLSHYENGLREPGLTFVRNACIYYGVSADYLLGRSEVRTPLVATGEERNALDGLAAALTAILSALEAEPTLLEEVADSLALNLYRLTVLLGARNARTDLLTPLCEAAMRLSELRLLTRLSGRRLDFALPPDFCARIDELLAKAKPADEGAG